MAGFIIRIIRISKREPAAMYVCVCNAVTDHEIRGAVKLGIRTLEDLSATLGVATCCRRCTDCARQVLHDAVGASAVCAGGDD